MRSGAPAARRRRSCTSSSRRRPAGSTRSSVSRRRSTTRRAAAGCSRTSRSTGARRNARVGHSLVQQSVDVLRADAGAAGHRLAAVFGEIHDPAQGRARRRLDGAARPPARHGRTRCAPRPHPVRATAAQRGRRARPDADARRVPRRRSPGRVAGGIRRARLPGRALRRPRGTGPAARPRLRSLARRSAGRHARPHATRAARASDVRRRHRRPGGDARLRRRDPSRARAEQRNGLPPGRSRTRWSRSKRTSWRTRIRIPRPTGSGRRRSARRRSRYRRNGRSSRSRSRPR